MFSERPSLDDDDLQQAAPTLDSGHPTLYAHSSSSAYVVDLDENENAVGECRLPVAELETRIDYMTQMGGTDHDASRQRSSSQSASLVPVCAPGSFPGIFHYQTAQAFHQDVPIAHEDLHYQSGQVSLQDVRITHDSSSLPGHAVSVGVPENRSLLIVAHQSATSAPTQSYPSYDAPDTHNVFSHDFQGLPGLMSLPDTPVETPGRHTESQLVHILTPSDIEELKPTDLLFSDEEEEEGDERNVFRFPSGITVQGGISGAYPARSQTEGPHFYHNVVSSSQSSSIVHDYPSVIAADHTAAPISNFPVSCSPHTQTIPKISDQRCSGSFGPPYHMNVLGSQDLHYATAINTEGSSVAYSHLMCNESTDFLEHYESAGQGSGIPAIETPPVTPTFYEDAEQTRSQLYVNAGVNAPLFRQSANTMTTVPHNLPTTPTTLEGIFPSETRLDASSSPEAHSAFGFSVPVAQIASTITSSTRFLPQTVTSQVTSSHLPVAHSHSLINATAEHSTMPTLLQAGSSFLPSSFRVQAAYSEVTTLPEMYQPTHPSIPYYSHSESFNIEVPFRQQSSSNPQPASTATSRQLQNKQPRRQRLPGVSLDLFGGFPGGDPVHEVPQDEPYLDWSFPDIDLVDEDVFDDNCTSLPFSEPFRQLLMNVEQSTSSQHREDIVQQGTCGQDFDQESQGFDRTGASDADVSDISREDVSPHSFHRKDHTLFHFDHSSRSLDSSDPSNTSREEREPAFAAKQNHTILGHGLQWKNETETVEHKHRLGYSDASEVSAEDSTQGLQASGQQPVVVKRELRSKILKQRSERGEGPVDLGTSQAHSSSELTETDHARRATRRAQNRGAAKRHREKKRRKEDHMKKKLRENERVKLRLTSEVEELRHQVSQLRHTALQHQHCGDSRINSLIDAQPPDTGDVTSCDVRAHEDDGGRCGVGEYHGEVKEDDSDDSRAGDDEPSCR